jgi:hypothetical protein
MTTDSHHGGKSELVLCVFPGNGSSACPEPEHAVRRIPVLLPDRVAAAMPLISRA